MAKQPTFLKGIFTDYTQNSEFLYDMTAHQWTSGVQDTLTQLYVNPPCATSVPILDGIAATGKNVTIIPSKKRAMGPERIAGNAGAEPLDFRKAAAPGKPTEDNDPQLGLGGGSDVILEFVAQDWEPVATSASFKAVDEVLLHELVHALRQCLGQEDNTELIAPFAGMKLGTASTSELMAGRGPPPAPYTQVYQNLEEFVAILITNTYRSENLRIGLVRDHLGVRPRRGDPQPAAGQFRDPREETRTLGHPLNSPRDFLRVWRPQMEGLFIGLSRNATAQKIAVVNCYFNPFRVLQLERMSPSNQAASYAH